MSNTIGEVIEAFSAGEIVVVIDDDDREGEGDLIVAASLCTPQKMAFIVRHTSGIVCTPITAAHARRLRLDPMVALNDSAHTTAFTVSIDYRPGGTTGISAEERSACCRALTNPNVGADDFARPGHIFPLIAREGGVLVRSGHTEAAVDLCKLADLPPVGVISELMNDDGTVTKGTQVLDFASRHGLKVVTVADLIAWRQAREKLIERISSFPTDSPIGPLQAHVYQTPFDACLQVAYVFGDIQDGKNVLTRIHKPNITPNIFSGTKRMHAALQQIKRSGSGVLVDLRDHAVGVPLAPLGMTRREADRHMQWREVGLGAQILHDLGISSIRHITSSSVDFTGLSGFGLEIVETVPFEETDDPLIIK